MVDISQRKLKDVDWLLLVAPIALTVFGCVGISSSAPDDSFVKKQVISLGIGLAIAIVIMFTDYRKIVFDIAPFFYAAMLMLLVLVLVIGTEINGNKAWLRLAGFSLQPSEFAKAATILMLARHLAHVRQSSSLSLKDMAIMGAIVLAPVILVYLEHDTGTTLTFGAILGTFYFLGGMRKLFLAIGAVAVVVGLIGVYPHLKGYQRERINVIIHPEEADPKGFGYQTIQSVIAVGSGGVMGKGLGQGTQGKLGFLPFAWTDFIAAVIAEETGLAGILLMMVLYLLLIWRLIAVAKASRERAGSLLVMGFVGLIAFHILCNLGMVVALLPIMGIPLPLMSYGGTAVMSMFIGVGLGLSVRMRRFVN